LENLQNLEKIEVSVVIPCLNEEDTIGTCVDKIKRAFFKHNLVGEVVVVDNGCTDKSVSISLEKGARVLVETKKGYGNALRKGIDEAKGKFVIMADGDDTYDFEIIDQFINKLRAGADLVMGSRFKGEILKDAMSWSHRYIGNPILSGMLKLFFGGGVSDAHCGLRGFTKDAYNNMKLKTQGMEFASEMVIHALKEGVKIEEIPIKYYPRKGESKLNSFRDAWRHIRFMLLYSPKYLFLIPGILMFVVGIYVSLHISIRPLVIFGRGWDIHVMVLASMLAILGWQVFTMGLMAKSYINKIGLEKDKSISKFFGMLNLEIFIGLGILFFLVGMILFAKIFVIWYLHNFGPLDQIKTGILAMMFMAIGAQTIFSGFLMSVIKIDYK
jgi:glycosyltransferase involved in cell wall biosynthesis